MKEVNLKSTRFYIWLWLFLSNLRRPLQTLFKSLLRKLANSKSYRLNKLKWKAWIKEVELLEVSPRHKKKKFDPRRNFQVCPDIVRQELHLTHGLNFLGLVTGVLTVAKVHSEFFKLCNFPLKKYVRFFSLIKSFIIILAICTWGIQSWVSVWRIAFVWSWKMFTCMPIACQVDSVR